MKLKQLALAAAALAVLTSCGDEPVMSITARELAGTWECQRVPARMQQQLGKGAVIGPLILRENRNCLAEGFPTDTPLRLINQSGRWSLVDASMTPSGMCSIEIEGSFLSIQQRGNKLVLHYPVDVIEGCTVEYVRRECEDTSRAGELPSTPPAATPSSHIAPILHHPEIP